MRESIRFFLVSIAIPVTGIVIAAVFDEPDLGSLASATFLATLALFALIAISGRIARINRTLLLGFVPGMFLVLIAVALLVLASAGIMIFSLFVFFAHLVSRIPTGLIFTIGLGALLAVTQMFLSLKSLIRRAETTVVGKRIDRETHPELSSMIDKLALSMGSLRPENIVVGLSPNFFVTEADLICLDGKFSGRSLYISLPLCRILTVRELEAILAHEFGHFVGADTKFSRRFYPVYRGTAQSVAVLFAHSEVNGARGLAALPGAMMLMYFLNSFAIAENKIGRERELRADELAAQATSRKEMGSALAKIHAFSPCWTMTKAHMAETLREGRKVINASTLFGFIVNDSDKTALFRSLENSTTAHPTDTHPPLGLRLASLNETLETIYPDAVITNTSKPAVALFQDLESIERDLSDFENVLLYKSLGLSS